MLRIDIWELDNPTHSLSETGTGRHRGILVSSGEINVVAQYLVTFLVGDQTNLVNREGVSKRVRISRKNLSGFGQKTESDPLLGDIYALSFLAMGILRSQGPFQRVNRIQYSCGL